MGTTSTTKPSLEAFYKHRKDCKQCRETCDNWWSLPQPLYEQVREKLDLCEDGRKILRAIFN